MVLPLECVCDDSAELSVTRKWIHSNQELRRLIAKCSLSGCRIFGTRANISAPQDGDGMVFPGHKDRRLTKMMAFCCIGVNRAAYWEQNNKGRGPLQHFDRRSN